MNDRPNVRPVLSFDVFLSFNYYFQMLPNETFGAYYPGKEGSLTQILLNLIIEDMKSGPPSVRAPIPY